MRRKTTTEKLNEAISSSLLHITKAEVYHKTSRKTDLITNSFVENLQFLCESGCFTNCIGWIYERDHTTEQYIVEAGRGDGDSENIVTAYLQVCDGVDREDIERTLLFWEEE